MPDKVHVSITEVTTLVGKTKGFRLSVDGHEVTIPVDEALFAHYHDQFYRENGGTPQQKKRFATLMNLMRAAYKKGLADGKRSKQS